MLVDASTATTLWRFDGVSGSHSPNLLSANSCRLGVAVSATGSSHIPASIYGPRRRVINGLFAYLGMGNHRVSPLARGRRPRCDTHGTSRAGHRGRTAPFRLRKPPASSAHIVGLAVVRDHRGLRRWHALVGILFASVDRPSAGKAEFIRANAGGNLH